MLFDLCWIVFRCFASGQCKSISCLTLFTVTAVLKHRWAEEINFLDAANLVPQTLHHTEKSHYNPECIPNITALSSSAETIRDIHWLPIPFRCPSGYWSQHQVFIWVNFVPPRGGMCSERKPLILHEHVTSVTALRRLYLGGFFILFFLADVYLALWHPRSPTRTLRVVLSGTISSQSLRHGNIVPSSRFNSWPVIRQLS